MKEETFIHNRRKNPKGSVLFTVVAVMMVMIVFVLATLTIAGAANKRAYASYSKSQTTYTAQSALDATVEAIKNDENIAKNINGLSVNAQRTITVTGDESLGDTTVVATNKGQVNELDPATGQNKTSDSYIIELAATTSLGDETSTVSTYYIINPIKKTVDPVKKSNASSNGITVMGNLVDTGFQFNTYGGSSIGVGKDASRWVSVDANGVPTSTEYVQYTFANNHGKTASGFAINGNLKFTTPGNYEFNEGEGVRVFGNIQVDNNTNFISHANTSDYDSLPYIFAERNISLGSTISIGDGDTSNPWIVYCGGSLNFTNTSFDVVGDIYIYDHDFSVEKQDYSDYDESHTLNATSMFGTSANSSLLSWAEGLISGSTHNIGGNLYTKGNLRLQQTTIGNDCYVKGNLNVEGVATTIKGNLCVEGNITTSDNLIVEGTVYCGGTVTGNILAADGSMHSDYTDTANKFDFPADRATLDDVMKMTTDDEDGFVATQPVESSYYLDSTGEYIYPTEIPDAYLAAVNGTVYANSTNSVTTYAVDPNGNYIRYTNWDGTPGYREKYWSGETSPDGVYYSIESTVYTSQAIPPTITESCTIQGWINQDIVVDPGDNELWIKLDNVSMENHNIIVENSGSGRVNFYVPEGGYFTINNHGSVLTRSALNGCYNSTTELKSKYKSTDADAQSMIPNIYFYSGKNATITPGGNNGGFVSAYIYAPYATVNLPLDQGSSYVPKSFTDSYDVWNAYKDDNGKLDQTTFNNLYDSALTYDVSGSNICAIGAIVADQLSIQNSGAGGNVFFVDNTVAQVKSDDDDDDDDDSGDGADGDDEVFEAADGKNIKIISYANGSYSS